MKYLVIILSFLFLLSCDGYLGVYTDPDIIIHTDTIPSDTSNDTIVTLPLFDTCDSYQEIVNTKFSTWATNLDGIFPNTYTWVYKPSTTVYLITDIDQFMLEHYGPTKIYYSGVNVAVIVNGLDNPSYIQNHSLYLVDAFGTYNLVYFSKYNLTFNGTLTFEQFFNELILHSNFNRLGFWNTAFTHDEYLMLIDYIIDNCINGTGNIIDLRAIPGIVDQERIDQLHLAHFTVLQ